MLQLEVQPETKRLRHTIDRIPLLVCADNFWLLATSSQMLQMMGQLWLQIQDSYDAEVGLSECVWTTAAKDEEAGSIRLKGVLLERRSRAKGFVALGATITFDNCSSVPLERCIARAWAALNRHRKILCTKNSNLRLRLGLVQRFAPPALLHCIGSLHHM